MIFKRLKKKLTKTPKEKMQFSKKIALLIVVFSGSIVAFMVCLNFLLLWFGKESMSQETIAAITTYGGITATAGTVVYGALTGWRDTVAIAHNKLDLPGPYGDIPASNTDDKDNPFEDGVV